MSKNQIKTKDHNDALVEVDPMTELSQFRSNFDRMLGGMRCGHWEEAWNAGWGCDVKDSDAEVVVRTEAPGFEPDEIEVQVSGNRLILQAEHRVKAGEDNIRANYKNGVLEVHLPKSDAVTPKRVAVTAN